VAVKNANGEATYVQSSQWLTSSRCVVRRAAAVADRQDILPNSGNKKEQPEELYYAEG
jgi:hypothetical protein